jgi:hypothetical protein
MMRHVGRTPSGQELESIGEPVRDLIDTEDIDAGGGKLDRERDTVEASTDIGHSGSPRGVELKVAPTISRSLSEQLHRFESRDFIRWRASRWNPEARDLVDRLAGNTERLSTRGNDAHVGA